MIKKKVQRWSGLFLLSAMCALPGVLEAASPGQAPDNTRTNKADQKPGAATADQAKNNKTDLQLASHIRRGLIKDKSLSTYGHNVKIIAQDGKVTLKGPVHSDQEKKTVLDVAAKYAGAGNVDDQLEIKPDSK